MPADRSYWLRLDIRQVGCQPSHGLMPQLQYVSTVNGMKVQLGPLDWSFLLVGLLAPAICHDPSRMAGVSGDLTMISRAAGLPLSHPVMGTSALRCKPNHHRDH